MELILNTELNLYEMNGKAFCDSLQIAETFGKGHKNVLRDIDNFSTEDSFWRLNFELSDYESRGKQYPKYFLTKDGFTLLVMGYGGKKAMKFKIDYIKAFNQMEQFIRERQSPHWQQTRLESKTNRRLETDEIKLFIEYAKDQGSKSAEKYYIHFTKLANKAVGISADQRDSISAIQLNTLILVENIINHCISEGMDAQTPYKNVYMMCKARIEQFREVSYLAVA